MAEKAVGMNCGVVEGIKRNAMIRYGHVRRIRRSDWQKRTYRSDALGLAGRGRPPLFWEGNVEQYVSANVCVHRRVRDLKSAKKSCR